MAVSILAAAIVTYGCTNRSSNHDLLLGKGDGGTGASSGGLLGGGNGTSTGNDEGTGAGDGRGGNTPGVAPGGREPPLVSVEKAVFNSMPTCRPQPDASACTACLQNRCCGYTQQCFSNNFCLSLAGCMSECQDRACMDACHEKFGDNGAVEEYQEILSCGQSDCPACN